MVLKTELNTYHVNMSKIIFGQIPSKFMVIDKKNAPTHEKNLELREKNDLVHEKGKSGDFQTEFSFLKYILSNSLVVIIV